MTTKKKSKDTTRSTNANVQSLPKVTYVKPYRKVRNVFIHCSASDVPEHDDISVIAQWHLERGFKGIGYHYFITKKGEIQEGRSLERISAAQSGYNTHSIAICVSGLDKFTKESLNALKALCFEIDRQHGKGTLNFKGHCEVAPKRCPVFDYIDVLNIDPQTHKIMPRG